jgi:1-deoxy-D-xylulose-5-phosphate reductoisomerase
MKKKIAILGSTGSIGNSTLKIIDKNKHHFKVELLSTNKNIKKIFNQLRKYNVKNIVIHNEECFNKASFFLKKKKINIFQNLNDYFRLNKNKFDYVMSSISGLDGLSSTLKIIKHTKKIAIANKESIICGWNLINKELKKNKTIFVPVDSEHFSIWSLIGSNENINQKIEKIYLTASGGPFLNLPLNKFKKINIKDALNHPNWKMGSKISIDSATMMNKVFEIIEAKNIFNIDLKKLSIVIEPSSYIHCFVKFKSGLIKLLAHETDMKIPIFNSLIDNNDKIHIKTKKIDFTKFNNLKLDSLNQNRYPITKVLNKINNKTTLFDTILVSLNDILVYKFLRNEISFNDISNIFLKLINTKEFTKFKYKSPKNVDEILKMRELVSFKLDSISI